MNIEEMTQKAEELQSKISGLKCDLSSHASPIGDWKVIKCYEAKLQDKKMPYDLDELMAKRQAVRDEINNLQEELDELSPKITALSAEIAAKEMEENAKRIAYEEEQERKEREKQGE